MKQRYADLMLYMGLVDNHGFGEGRFYVERTDEYNQRRYIRAVQRVREIIDMVSTNEEDSFRLHYGYFKVVKDENEARRLIRFALENIQNSEEIIELIDSIHGKIRFFRKVRFNGATLKDKQNIVDTINKSGIGPNTDPEKYGVDYSWKRALEFH